jgi:hypothetical protein
VALGDAVRPVGYGRVAPIRLSTILFPLSTLHPFMIIEDSTLAAEAFSSERIIT